MHAHTVCSVCASKSYGQTHVFTDCVISVRNKSCVAEVSSAELCVRGRRRNKWLDVEHRDGFAAIEHAYVTEDKQHRRQEVIHLNQHLEPDIAPVAG